SYFSGGQVAPAVEYLERVAEAFEFAYDKSPTPRFRTAISDAYQRLGFLGALLGDVETADTAIRRSTQIREKREWLDAYNGGYIRALRKEFAAAADLAREAKSS